MGSSSSRSREKRGRRRSPYRRLSRKQQSLADARVYLYLFPPVWLVVLVLAYVFQSRVADLRTELDQPDDGRLVRLVRAGGHAAVVLLVGVVSPYGSALAVNAMLGEGARPLREPCLWAGTVLCFVAGVAIIDKAVDLALTFTVARGRAIEPRYLRVRDVLRFEVPDLALFVCLLLASLMR